MNQSNLQNRSARIKKEKKNLQKYDSNSIDEEEFQDCKYFHFNLHRLFTFFTRFFKSIKEEGVRQTKTAIANEGNPKHRRLLTWAVWEQIDEADERGLPSIPRG
jgi:hypothetical protein